MNNKELKEAMKLQPMTAEVRSAVTQRRKLIDDILQDYPVAPEEAFRVNLEHTDEEATN